MKASSCDIGGRTLLDEDGFFDFLFIIKHYLKNKNISERKCF
jgi:hypothetical protein